jgi:acetyl esterase/lipase
MAFICSAALFAQQAPTEPVTWPVDCMMDYSITPNVVYSVASNYECKLDVYARRGAPSPVPVVIHIHGGGWVGGQKETNVFWLMPYVQMGCAVVNVEYRLAKVALAPAAVEDCRLALRWVMKNARAYNFDSTKIIVTGGSAGGHLALMTGMLDSTAGFDAPKDWDQVNPPLRVAAIINWYGITDVKDLLSGANRQNYAVSWLGSQQDREAQAVRISPLTYLRKGLPPLLTIHGTADQLVPYNHAVRLHAGLQEAGVPNELITIQNGRHGGFTRDQMLMIFTRIRAFLKANGAL